MFSPHLGQPKNHHKNEERTPKEEFEMAENARAMQEMQVKLEKFYEGTTMGSDIDLILHSPRTAGFY